MKELSVTMNGVAYRADEGMSILDLCRREGIHVPTLCDHPDLHTKGICRICVVEVKGMRTLQASCSTPLAEGREINTTGDKVRRARKTIV